MFRYQDALRANSAVEVRLDLGDVADGLTPQLLVALLVMLVVSMLSPRQVRRLGVLGFIAAFALLGALPFFGTDFGKGATRWCSNCYCVVSASW